MAITNDGIPVKPNAVVVEAYLDGIWTDISADVLPDTLQTASGIDGNGDFDLIAAPGRMTFSLRNMKGKYYIAGATPLSGWGINTAVRLSVVYDDYSLGQFVGVVRDKRPVV
jgi:hypothetical protein